MGLELRGVAVAAAMHRFGCRVLCRLGEHHLSADQAATTLSLFEELLGDAGALLTHSFARHVLETLIEFGGKAHRQTLAGVVALRPYRYACSRCTSYVFEKLLAHGSPADVERLGTALLQDEASFTKLAQHECGWHVAEALGRRAPQSASAEEARRWILERAQMFKTHRYVSRLIQALS